MIQQWITDKCIIVHFERTYSLNNNSLKMWMWPGYYCKLWSALDKPHLRDVDVLASLSKTDVSCSSVIYGTCATSLECLTCSAYQSPGNYSETSNQPNTHRQASVILWIFCSSLSQLTWGSPTSFFLFFPTTNLGTFLNSIVWHA